MHLAKLRLGKPEFLEKEDCARDHTKAFIRRSLMRKMEMNNCSHTLTYMRLREKTTKEQEGIKIKGRLKIEKILRYNKIHTLSTFGNPFSMRSEQCCTRFIFPH